MSSDAVAHHTRPLAVSETLNDLPIKRPVQELYAVVR